MQGMPTDPSPRPRCLRLLSSGSHVGVPAGDDVVDVKLNFGVAVDGGDAEAATGGFDEAGVGGEVKVLAALQLGEVALFHTQGLSELLLGQAHGTTDFAGCGPLQAEELHLVDDLGREHDHPAVVLVSNNRYALDPPQAPGTRRTLDSGRLGIVVLDSPRDTSRPTGRAWSATSFEVTAPGPVHAGVDGEAVDLRPPLEFVIQPGALRVRIPASRAGRRDVRDIRPLRAAPPSRDDAG
jgi:hypothetical protein